MSEIWVYVLVEAVDGCRIARGPDRTRIRFGILPLLFLLVPFEMACKEYRRPGVSNMYMARGLKYMFYLYAEQSC